MNNRQRKKLFVKKNARWNPKPSKFTFTDEERWNLRQTLSIYITSALREFLNYPLWMIPDLITPPNEEGLGYTAFGKCRYGNEYWEKVTEVLKAQVSGVSTDVKVNLNHISAAEREWRTILVKMLWSYKPSKSARQKNYIITDEVGVWKISRVADLQKLDLILVIIREKFERHARSYIFPKAHSMTAIPYSKNQKEICCEIIEKSM